jgi:hypothetical protein
MIGIELEPGRICRYADLPVQHICPAIANDERLRGLVTGCNEPEVQCVIADRKFGLFMRRRGQYVERDRDILIGDRGM